MGGRARGEEGWGGGIPRILGVLIHGFVIIIHVLSAVGVGCNYYDASVPREKHC